jgi:hypothetical protein
MSKISVLHEEFLKGLMYRNIKAPTVEFKFHPKRLWRADCCWEEEKLIVEVDGGVWSNGRHNRGSGYIKDCEKKNTAVLMGYHVMNITHEHISNGWAFEWVGNFLNNKDSGSIPTYPDTPNNKSKTRKK